MLQLSLCMIVKNEEQVLARCLDSVKGIVDEIIIADTGSTDSTVEIASNYTTHIYNFKWTDSFSDARNFVQKKASGKWILVLDADEFVDRDNLIEVKEKLAEQREGTDALVATVYNFAGNQGEHIVQHKTFRLYRNCPEIKYFRTIHEQLARDDRAILSDISELLIYHSGYLSKTVESKNKTSRNLKLIEKEVEHSGNIAFDYFNMGNELMGEKRFEEALESYQKAYMNKSRIEYGWVSLSVVQIITILIELKRYDDALAVIIDAEEIWDNAPEFRCFKGSILLLKNRVDDAKEVLLNLIENKEKYKSFIKSIDYIEFHPYLALAAIYEKECNIRKAIECYAHVLSVNSRSNSTFYKLIQLLSKYCNHDEFITFINKHNLSDEKNIKRLLKGLLDFSQLSLFEEFYNKYNVKNKLDGIPLKYKLLRNEIEEVIDELNTISINDLQALLSEDIIDHLDLVLLYTIQNDQNLMVKLEKMVDLDILRFIKDMKIICESDKQLFVLLLERCIRYQLFETFEKILQSVTFSDPSVYLAIGNLLFKYDFNDLALEFFEKVGDIKLLDEVSFINIIISLHKQNDKENSLRFALQAIEFGYNNYIIFKYAIEILSDLDRQDVKEEIIQLAQKYYPDSNWLKDMLIFG